MPNRLYFPDGSIKAEDVPTAEFVQAIQKLSIVGVRGDDIPGKVILFFFPGFSAHNEIYIGEGKNLCASAEPEGYTLKKIHRWLDPKKAKFWLRIYTNSKMTVNEMEAIKTRVYNMLDTPYAWKELPFKAWYSVCKAWNKFWKIEKDIPLPPDNPNVGVCNERTIEAFQPDEREWPFIRVVKRGVTLEQAAPADTDAYMESAEAKKAGWYIAAEWYPKN